MRSHLHATADRKAGEPTGGEAIEGYVMDIACIRKAPVAALTDRAADHPTVCGLMGHCIESGYGVVTEDGGVHLLDDHATLGVIRHLLDTSQETGVRIRVVRQRDGEEMVTASIGTA